MSSTKSYPALSAAALGKSRQEGISGKDNLLSLIESSLGPTAFIASLWLLAFYFDGTVTQGYFLLGVIVFALTFPGRGRLQSSIPLAFFDITINWLWVAGLLLTCCVLAGFLREFSNDVLLAWAWVAPLTEFVFYLGLRVAAPALIDLQGPRQRAIIVGMNEQGLALATKLESAQYSRLDSNNRNRLIGKLDDLANIVKSNHIQLIYLSLPMASQPRILHILDQLKDTTASIYFVPDMFLTDLIQGHSSSVCGMPVISVCETPFRGANGMVKRLSDIVLSALILALIFPLLLAVGLAVKLSSPGAIIFKQRRYGLDGDEIVVYKFRSMTVVEDGSDNIQQAQKNDKRITPLGSFLRRTSLDELPQFINVLQGRMSIVGPRPHAVAHNELYRKLIKGYMVRHKVKPGITGWAQVNGFRGETETLGKMQGRIDFDLDYLRNWSLRLDIQIILKTIRLVLKDQRAY
jgi:putative colanic acid biosysnthesis UDP-glucose lipid carrier transferase